MKLSRRMRLLAGGCGIGLASLLGWWSGSGGLSGEHAQLLAQRVKYVEALRTVRAQREARAELDEREASYVARTLGANIEAVDSRIRQRLFALGSTAGLADLSVVTSGSASARRETPAKRAFDRRGSQKILREETDFIEVTATLTGEGTIEQVLRLLGWVDVDPWIKRVLQVRLNPDKSGDSIKLSLQLVTIFLPGRSPGEALPAGTLDPDRIAGLIGGNPFRIPPPPRPKAPPTPPAPEPAPKPVPPPPVVVFPYDSWLLTGVANGPDGPEAWLRNAANDNRRTLRPGGSIGEAELIEIEGDQARFRLGAETFKVRIGRSLATGRESSL